MSERSSFCTEWIYCSKCFDAAQKVFAEELSDEDPLFATGLIAGKISAPDSNGELRMFEFEIGPKLSEIICHRMRIAVMAEGGSSTVFIVEPGKGIRYPGAGEIVLAGEE